MEKIISNKAASFASMELARFALERADQRASSILEQYRKSTDRNYTLAGFVMTVFIPHGFPCHGKDDPDAGGHHPPFMGRNRSGVAYPVL